VNRQHSRLKVRCNNHSEALLMADITLKLAIQGEDATEDVVFSLKDWIQQEQISGLKQVSTDDGQTESGKMGIDPITVLSVVLASKAVVELVKAIHVWIQSTRPKVVFIESTHELP
jgi:hypothetical protein